MFKEKIKKMSEEQSIQLIISWLNSIGYEAEGTQSTNPYSYYDIVAKNGDLKIYIEVKRRRENYGDSIIESYKYIKFLEALEKGEIDAGFVISVFENDCYFSVSNINNPINISEKIASKTTDFNNHKKVMKEFVHFNQETKIYYTL